MKPGTIFLDNAHQSADSRPSRQLLIILSDGQQCPYIAVNTTSQPRDACGIQSGCQIKDRFPNFFLPLRSTYLKENTWIQLDCFSDLNSTELVERHKNNEIERICELPRKLLEALLICAISSKDISEDQEKELWKTLGNIDIYFQGENLPFFS